VHFSQGSLYVADMMNHRVLAFKAGSTQGTLVAGTGKKGDSLDKLANPTGITVCPKTNAVYVADNKNYRVVKWAPGAQEGVLVAGGSKGSGLAQFKEPRDVAIGAAGVYVSDRTNGRVVLWTEGAQEGILLASVSSPTGLAAASDFLFIAEQNAHQVTAWSIQAEEDEGNEDEGKEDEGKEDEGKDEGDGEGLLPEVGNMKLKTLESDLHRCAGSAAEMLDDEIDPGDCARLCDAKAACRFAVYDAKNAVCESYTTCSRTEKTDAVWIVYEKEGGEEWGEMEQVIGDMHRVVFDSHFKRCGGRPKGGWDSLGRDMDPEDCARACDAKSTCKAAGYNTKTAACAEFAACERSQGSAVVWVAYKKGDDSAPPPPDPPSGKCCMARCSAGECAQGLFCCPNQKRCFDDTTGGSWGEGCDACAEEEDTSPQPLPPPTPRPTSWRPPTPKPTSGGGGGGSAENNAALNAHNFYRCMHGAPPMTWDTRVEAKAREWAQRGKFDHSPNSFRTINGVYHGENLAMGWSGFDMKSATKMWYDEINLTPGKRGRVDGFSMQTGHYTQVVWKSSVRLGCGESGGLVVCMYGPGGNYGGEYGTQVSVKVKQASQCSQYSFIGLHNQIEPDVKSQASFPVEAPSRKILT